MIHCIKTRNDTVNRVLEVEVTTTDGATSWTRPYYFNIPEQHVGRMAAIFETCVAEAIRRHEQWASGSQQGFGGEQSCSGAPEIPTDADDNTEAQPAAQKEPAQKKKSAPVQQEEETTTPAAGPKKKKPAAAKKKPESPRPVEVEFQKTAECKKAMSSVVSKLLGPNWTKDQDYKSDVQDIARKAESDGVVCLRDGEVTEEFETFVNDELHSRYEFN